jgi:hypothetical protein
MKLTDPIPGETAPGTYPNEIWKWELMEADVPAGKHMYTIAFEIAGNDAVTEVKGDYFEIDGERNLAVVRNGSRVASFQANHWVWIEEDV